MLPGVAYPAVFLRDHIHGCLAVGLQHQLQIGWKHRPDNECDDIHNNAVTDLMKLLTMTMLNGIPALGEHKTGHICVIFKLLKLEVVLGPLPGYDVSKGS